MLCVRCQKPKASRSPLCFHCAHLRLSVYGKRQMPRIWRQNKRTAFKRAKDGIERLLRKFFSGRPPMD